MKRMFAAVALLASVGLLLKLAYQPLSGHRPLQESFPSSTIQQPNSPEPGLVERYRDRPEQERAVVARVWEKFRLMAEAIDRTDGYRGLELLDRFDLEAIFLYEKHPKEFKQLRELLNDQAAAEILVRWREYFGLKRGDDSDRGTLITEIGRLSGSQRQLVARFPNILPLMLADASGISEIVATFDENEKDLADAFVILSLISLESGSANVRTAERTLERHGKLALDGFRILGAEGFSLVDRFGDVFREIGTSAPLDQVLILSRVNSDYLAELLRSHRPESVAHQLAHLFSVGPKLVEAVGGHPDALRLAIEHGDRGEKALLRAGPDAAEVIYGGFTNSDLQKKAVIAIGDHGAMAVAILDKYATDPDFRSILLQYGSDIIPPIAHADASPQLLAELQTKQNRSFKENLANLVLFASGESGQATIRQIKDDGLERVTSLNANELKFYQFLPTYDMLHLGNVLRSGYTPTSGEMAWALIDGCFVVVDALSLATIQLEGAVVSEAVRSEIKAVVREGAKVSGREVAGSAGESVGKKLTRIDPRLLKGGTEIGEAGAERLAKLWAVRSAGGTYQVLRRVPEALAMLPLARVVDLARPFCSKAGIRLTTWTPVRLWKDGVEVVSRIPPGRGLKYLAAQVTLAEVGFVGFKKMEEHLSSRRPTSRLFAE